MGKAKKRRRKQKAQPIDSYSFEAPCGDTVLVVTDIPSNRPLWRQSFALLDHLPGCSDPAKCGAEVERITEVLGIET